MTCNGISPSREKECNNAIYGNMDEPGDYCIIWSKSKTNIIYHMWNLKKWYKWTYLHKCPALWDPLDYRPPGCFIHGILQARILESIAIPSFRGSSQPRDWTQVSCIAGRSFTFWATREGLFNKQFITISEFYFTFKNHWFGCGRSSLRPVGSLAAVWELVAVACGI